MQTLYLHHYTPVCMYGNQNNTRIASYSGLPVFTRKIGIPDFSCTNAVIHVTAWVQGYTKMFKLDYKFFLSFMHYS